MTQRATSTVKANTSTLMVAEARAAFTLCPVDLARPAFFRGDLTFGVAFKRRSNRREFKLHLTATVRLVLLQRRRTPEQRGQLARGEGSRGVHVRASLITKLSTGVRRPLASVITGAPSASHVLAHPPGDTKAVWP